MGYTLKASVRKGKSCKIPHSLAARGESRRI
jgi:hypothetical protein